VALSFGATREIVAQFGSDRMCSVSRCGWRWSRCASRSRLPQSVTRRSAVRPRRSLPASRHAVSP